MTNSYILISVIIMTAVTVLLRFTPFLIFRNKEVPPIISYLGKVLPCAIIGMLVVYCLKGTTFSALSGWLPASIASAAVIGCHVWKRNTLLSILAGTICYMVLIRMF